MGTNFTEVFDLFMMLQNDYRLLALYNQSSDDFTTYLEGWLIMAVNEFKIGVKPNQSLAYDTTTQTFSETLKSENIIMLAQLMVKYWLEKTVHDVLQMGLNIQDHDFKHYAESQNLKAKQDLLNVKKEETSQMMIEYGYKNNDWSSWGSGNFFGG